MSRTLHIFRKDLRHFWMEVLLSWCLLGLYVWQFGEKLHTAHAGFTAVGVGGILGAGSGLTGFLLVLGWGVLVVRLVQDERLVGDRQFWLTRPYRWVELLASKIVFVLLFVHVPLLIAQLVMLRLAGFAPLPYLGGLVYMHATLLAFTATAFTIATVTATLVQTILAVFVVLLYSAGNSLVMSWVPNSSMPHLQSAFDAAEDLILLGAIIAVILLQYARRRTALSRGIIIGMAVLTTLIGVVTPYARLIAKTYPLVRSDQDSGLRVVLDTRKPEKPPTAPRFNRIPAKPREEKRVNVIIPLLASVSNENELIEINGIRVSIDLLGSQRWQSYWQPYGSVIVLPETGMAARFSMPKNIFESLKSSPVRVRIESALSVFRKGSEQWQVTAEDGDFPAPRLGLCLLQNTPDMLECRAPLRGATRMLGSAHSSESTCESPEDTDIADFTAFSWKLDGNTGPEPGISPVVEEPLYFNKQNPKRGDEARFVRLCPGTPMYFTSLELARRISTVTSLNDIQLSQYRIVSSYLGAVGIGIDVGR
jgi:hypothetical protein